MTGNRRRSVASSPGSSEGALRHGKLRAPLVSQHYVRRSRLFTLLDDVTAASLTLIVAPAGAGKTSLLAGWLAETGATAAWLSLDEADHDAGQFWMDFIAAVDTVVPGYGESASSRLRQFTRESTMVDALLVDLDGEERPPVIVVIDDFHLVDDEVVGPTLALLAQHLPAWLHLVGLSRREPKMALERLRTRNQLGEIGFAELRFSPAEAVELLTMLAPTLSEERMHAVAQQSEGWAASLQLVALAERSAQAQVGFDAPPDADVVMLQDYVWYEVLAAESPELIEVLQATAVVKRVNASLAHALTGRVDAGRLVLRARARGLFVTRLGTEGWVEVHSLVRGVLIAELRNRDPQQLAELHTRAARWFEDAGEVVPALEHWLAADRPRDALRLLAAKNAELYDTAREATVLQTISAIPPHVAAEDLDAAIEFAWCHLLVSRKRFLELVEQLHWWSERSDVDDLRKGRVCVLRSIAATMSGSWAEGGDLARQAMAQFGEAWWRDPLGRISLNMVAREVAMSERWNDGADEVRDLDLALRRDAERRLAFEGTRAFGEALAGRPLDAIRIAAGVRQAASISQMTILRAELLTAEAIANRELGDRAKALEGLQHLAESPAETMLHCKVLATLELVQARLDEGDLDAAEALFQSAEMMIELDLPGPGARTWLARAGTLVALAGGHLDRARRWADQVDDSFWRGVSVARVCLAAGERHEALACLDTAEPRCVRHDVVLSLLRARAVDDHDEAMKLAARAVEQAAADGLLQTVASEGPDATELAERVAWRAPEQWFDRLRRAAAERRQGASQQMDMIEQLTERERDVLRFLPSRLTVYEIANELYVSVNTLKFHLKIIYRKLGVSSRSEAAEVARKMTSGHSSH